MSNFLQKGISGTNFARHLLGREEKQEEQPNRPVVGLFQDIEAQAIKEEATDYDYEQNYTQHIQGVITSSTDPTEEYQFAQKLNEKAFKNLKHRIQRPRSKQAPGPDRRKIVLEDEE